MAKKSRKARVTTRANAVSQRPDGKQTQTQNQAVTQKSVKQPAVAAVNIMQPGHYDYVTQDLIRIGIISAVLILILVALTFIPALKT